MKLFQYFFMVLMMHVCAAQAMLADGPTRELDNDVRRNYEAFAQCKDKVVDLERLRCLEALKSHIVLKEREDLIVALVAMLAGVTCDEHGIISKNDSLGTSAEFLGLIAMIQAFTFLIHADRNGTLAKKIQSELDIHCARMALGVRSKH